MERVRRNALNLGAISGSSPSETLYYFIVLFDIADQKKYRILVKLLKRYGERIQKSVFEGHATSAQLKSLDCEITKLMNSNRFFNPDDKIRLYRMAGNCNAIIYGDFNECHHEEIIFF